MITLDPWTVDPTGTPGTALHDCLVAAVHAPSVYNSQPWRFHVGHGFVDLYADGARRLPVVDTSGREQAISLGAALFNLRVAILNHHRIPLVRLLPDPSRPDLVARVSLGPPVRPDATVRALAAAIPQRHTNRRPFTSVTVPAEVLAELSGAARTEGARLTVLDEPARWALLALVRSADVRLRRDPHYRDELTVWTSDDTDRPDGVARPEFGPWDALETLPLRDFGLTRTTGPRRGGRFEPDPTVVVLSTEADGREQWLRAGQALERVLLTATVRGLATTPMTQPLEVPELRELVDSSGAPQVILRVGYGPACSASSRRPIRDVLVLD